MAAALYNHLIGATNADSAGTNVGSPDEPEGLVIETRFRTMDFFDLMEENGMYLRGNCTKKLTPEMIDAADIVVCMAEEPFIPQFLASNAKVRWWSVENPPFATRSVCEKTYGQIKALIGELLKEFE